MRPVTGGVCAALDFKAGAIGCGIKTGRATRDDLAVVVSERAAVAAGTFTTNRVKAAPVRVSMEHLRTRDVRAVVLNSGNANACTGRQGIADARAMTDAVAKAQGLTAGQVLVCSTGRIGVPMPVDRIVRGIAAVQTGRRGSKAAARAIMTSDTFPKEIALEVSTEDGTFRIGGIAKGAGMIDPTMATMLCVVTTDAIVTRPALRAATRSAVEDSFNRITVDGDMSTNDTVLVLANGASGVEPSPKVLRAALENICRELARMIVRDGEGVSRFVEVEVIRAHSVREARRAAEAVANSTLVKCAWAGGDPNWGRILDAIGYSGVRFDESKVSIFYDGVPVAQRGVAASTPQRRLRAIAARKHFHVTVDLGAGGGSDYVWTTDLTEEYVRLNLGE